MIGKYNGELFEMLTKIRPYFGRNKIIQHIETRKIVLQRDDYIKKNVPWPVPTDFFGNIIRARTRRPIYTVPGMKEVECSLDLKQKHNLNKSI